MSKEITPEYMKFGFKGIKYSKVTSIFYKFKKGQLYKFRAYSGSLAGWETSDYQDSEDMAKKWVDATEEQIEKHELLKNK